MDKIDTDKKLRAYARDYGYVEVFHEDKGLYEFRLYDGKKYIFPKGIYHLRETEEYYFILPN